MLYLPYPLSIGLSGYAVFHFRGFPTRYPEEIRALTSSIDFGFTEQARYGKCHFDRDYPKNHAAVGSSECTENAKPEVLLWGDSYAAALYPGLVSVKEKFKFGITQTTSCGTSPFLDATTGNACISAEKMNSWTSDVLKLISLRHPAIVILHAFWPAYGDSRTLLLKMKTIVTKISKISPRSKVVIIGTPPTWGNWEDGLPKEMYRYWKESPNHQFAPEYMKLGLVDDFDDGFFKIELPKIGATFISIRQILCQANGCLTRVGPEMTDLTEIDMGHLSPAGSRYLVNRIADKIFLK
jgi:hypothetical protein